jgi:hypothetical protein
MKSIKEAKVELFNNAKQHWIKCVMSDDSHELEMFNHYASEYMEWLVYEEELKRVYTQFILRRNK